MNRVQQHQLDTPILPLPPLEQHEDCRVHAESSLAFQDQCFTRRSPISALFPDVTEVIFVTDNARSHEDCLPCCYSFRSDIPQELRRQHVVPRTRQGLDRWTSQTKQTLSRSATVPGADATITTTSCSVVPRLTPASSAEQTLRLPKRTISNDIVTLAGASSLLRHHHAALPLCQGVCEWLEEQPLCHDGDRSTTRRRQDHERCDVDAEVGGRRPPSRPKRWPTNEVIDMALINLNDSDLGQLQTNTL